MIKLIKVESKHDDVRIASAVKIDQNEEADYLLEFTTNESSLNAGNLQVYQKVILRHQINKKVLISYDFKLKRGLYDVMVTQVKAINGTDIQLDESSRQKYNDPVMVGGKYNIRAKIKNEQCYGKSGIRVMIISDEIELDSNTMYYTVLREGLKNIRYYIPFNHSKKIDFFVENISSDEFSLNLGNPSFEIVYV
jgi:hypothetical protein